MRDLGCQVYFNLSSLQDLMLASLLFTKHMILEFQSVYSFIYLFCCRVKKITHYPVEQGNCDYKLPYRIMVNSLKQDKGKARGLTLPVATLSRNPMLFEQDTLRVGLWLFQVLFLWANITLFGKWSNHEWAFSLLPNKHKMLLVREQELKGELGMI